MDISGAGALVSGGASGLGEATVRRLHEKGAHVVIADLNAEKGEALAGELGDRASFIETNVTDEGAVQAAVDLAGGACGSRSDARGSAGPSASPASRAPIHRTSSTTSSRSTWSACSICCVSRRRR
jgi:NAD(P)-dependent dehydrogenase (short-subunit alcohol dehydrogenase family)